MIRRTCCSLILVVLLATVSFAFAPAPVYREPPTPKVSEIFASLQGIWEVEQTVNLAGRGRVAAARRINQRIRIQGTSWTYIYVSNGIERESTRYEIALDPKASPASLDLEQVNQRIMLGGLAPAGGMAPAGGLPIIKRVALKGIVKVEGDTLTYCYVSGYNQNAERPRDFVVGNQLLPNGTTAMTMTLKKVK